MRRHRQHHQREVGGRLSNDAKFDLKQALDLPFTTEWLLVPLTATHGQYPRLEVLHPSLVHAVQGAYKAANS